jgi:hypothetical protein
VCSRTSKRLIYVNVCFVKWKVKNIIYNPLRITDVMNPFKASCTLCPLESKSILYNLPKGPDPILVLSPDEIKENWDSYRNYKITLESVAAFRIVVASYTILGPDLSGS